MTIIFDHTEDYKRMMFGVIADSRQNIPEILNKRGDVIQAYVESQWGLITPGVQVYGLWAANGSLVGYIGLQTGSGPASVKFLQLRPAFVPFSIEIQENINNFIVSGDWQFDFLS